MAKTYTEVTLVSGSVAASGTLLIYDLLCTLDDEVEHIWSRPPAFSSIIFFLNRYLPFVDTFLSFNLHFSINTPSECHIETEVYTWFIVIGILISESILMLRTYAIWNRRRAVLWTFSILLLVVAIPSFVMTNLEIKSLVYSTQPGIPGCTLEHASPIIIGSYILLLICETVIATLMAIKAWQHLRQTHSTWVFDLYVQNGLLYYFFAFILALANVFVPIVRPSLANWLATPQRVLHSIFCNRILLLIQKQKVAPGSTALFSSILDPEDEGSGASYVNSGTQSMSRLTTTHEREEYIEMESHPPIASPTAS